MKLIFIRHGKTAGNLERRYIGRRYWEKNIPMRISSLQAP